MSEPTEAMIEVGMNVGELLATGLGKDSREQLAYSVYMAMQSAAPPSPVVTDEQIAAIVDIVYGEMWIAVRPHMQTEIKDKIRAALQDKG